MSTEVRLDRSGKLSGLTDDGTHKRLISVSNFLKIIWILSSIKRRSGTVRHIHRHSYEEADKRSFI